MTLKKELDISSLWEKYEQTKDIETRNLLIEQYFSLVLFIAKRMFQGFPSSVELDDLISSGSIGLLQAVEKFDLSQGVLFKTFASRRIRGAILDELRIIDRIPRLARTRISQYEKAIKLTNKKNNKISSQEIANCLKVPLDEAKKIKKDATNFSKNIILLKEITNNNGEENGEQGFLFFVADEKADLPEKNIINKEEFEKLLSILNELEQVIFTLYYCYDCPMIVIGAMLGFSESRISQIHKTAIEKIKDFLKKKGELL